MSRTYTTAQGDMWDSIAYRQLGDVAHTDKLINANIQYHDYFTFPAGIVLTLPEIREQPASTLPPWKRA